MEPVHVTAPQTAQRTHTPYYTPTLPLRRDHAMIITPTCVYVCELTQRLHCTACEWESGCAVGSGSGGVGDDDRGLIKEREVVASGLQSHYVPASLLVCVVTLGDGGKKFKWHPDVWGQEEARKGFAVGLGGMIGAGKVEAEIS